LQSMTVVVFTPLQHVNNGNGQLSGLISQI